MWEKSVIELARPCSQPLAALPRSVDRSLAVREKAVIELARPCNQTNVLPRSVANRWTRRRSSTKRKTPAVGREAQEAAASSRPRTKSTTPAVGREARQSKTPAVGGDARASSHTKSKTRSSHSARTRSKTRSSSIEDGSTDKLDSCKLTVSASSVSPKTRNSSANIH